MSDEPQQQRRLPVWRTVKASYLALFKNLGLAIRLAIIPYTLGFAPLLVVAYIADEAMLADVRLTTPLVSSGVGLFFLANVVAALAVIPMITAWHRLVLLGHTHPESRLRFSIGRAEWIYLLKLFLYFLIAVLLGAAMFVAFFAGISTVQVLAERGSISSVIPMIAIVILMILVYGLFIGSVLRFCLVLPAAAIGEKFPFRAAWRQSKGNTWRMFFIFLLVLIPPTVGSIVVSLAVLGVVVFDPMSDAMPGSGVGLVHLMLNMPFWLIGLCASTSIWSWSYRYLVEGEDIVLPGERAT